MFRLTNTHQRRHQPVSFSRSIEVDHNPKSQSTALFQEHYRMEGVVACTFWANPVQLDRAKAQAEKTLRRHLYHDALGVLTDMELAVEEMDQDQLRKACMDMRDLFTGATP